MRRQNLKQNRKISRKLKSLYAFTMAVAIAASSGVVVSANNWTDEPYAFYYTGDGADIATPARTKQDDSMSYVKCNSSNPYNTTAYFAAKKGITEDKQGDAIGYQYATADYSVKPGGYKYITNKCRKKYGATYLCVSTRNGKAGSISGCWSPDNCSGR